MADQRFGLSHGEATSPTARTDPGTKQSFANIDIAQPCHDALIQQRNFDCGFLALQPGAQVGRVKIIG